LWRLDETRQQSRGRINLLERAFGGPLTAAVRTAVNG